ncbi:hypothetical protein BDB00DRAFT_792297 [Zychaea mexicana]|uniref:uncharacterized protein n=1 Tax=Zychaea mexicana TaxID=64656 RepID=UPI0022FEFCE4|nr:uncharacterized protein BDB00DRAFT_792297 [Zychaea mexicana]KAI9487925.1 hypothetical protein BDB00DRAFT_792297 [Zychaea mexicana]
MTLSSSSIINGHNNTTAAEHDEWEAMFDPQYTHLRRLTARKDTSPGPSLAETPTLPRIDHIKVQAPCPDQIDILPCPSASFAKHQRNEARLGLLQTIREQGLSDRHDTWKLMDQQEAQRNWQERLQEKINEDQEDDDDNEDNDPEGGDDTTEKPKKRNDKKPVRRRSFLYFAFGFLFPPLWIIGALHVPPQRQNPGSQAVDLLWKRRSRNAFFIFIVTVLVILILTLVLKPASIGWRTSNNMRPPPPHPQQPPSDEEI